MIKKNEQIAALALELLEDAEMSRTSVEGLVLKASRLARLVGDEEVTAWLSHERHGYNDTDTICRKYLGLTNRWIEIGENKAYFAGLVVHEALLDSWKEELEVIKRFVPSGSYAGLQFQNQQDQASKITTKMIHARKIVSAVRAQIQDFATRIYYESQFSHQAGTIFQQYQDQVDALLSSTASSAFTKLPYAFERLQAGDSEAISHALTTCRRVIDSFADSVFPASNVPVQIGQHHIEVGQKQVRNRMRAYMYARIGQCSRYERLTKALTSLYDRLSAGVHAEVDAGEARAIVLQTYLFLGELLTLAPPTKDG